MRPADVAIVHDYLTQRGGAERVVVSLLRAFPGSTVHTSLFDPDGTFPEFGTADVRTLPLNAFRTLRRNHRLSLPLLAPAFSRLKIDAPVALCSSSGWAHGARASGRKLVYCHAPARWLYQREHYLGARGSVGRFALAAVAPLLERWDRRAAASADRYLVNSRATQRLVEQVYGIDADVLAPPYALGPGGPEQRVEGLDAGFFLCVSRLLPYKNVGAVCAAFSEIPDSKLVVVGEGPERDALQRSAPRNVVFLGEIDDARLRWLYAQSRGLVTAAFEDFGLTPLEAAAFGRPTAALAFGGFLDTVLPDETGVFFDTPEPAQIAVAVRRLAAADWSVARLHAQAESFSEERFISAVREAVDQMDPGA